MSATPFASLLHVRAIDVALREAITADNWSAAIQRVDELVEQVHAALTDVVNLGRTVGDLSDADVGRLRNTAASAVAQRFGTRAALLEAAMLNRAGLPALAEDSSPSSVTQYTLYRLYDGAGVLLYVGISSNFSGRLAQHGRDKQWWESVASVRVEHYPDRASVEAAERVAIAAELPLHNIRR